MQLDLCYVMAILFHCGRRHAVRPMLCDGHSVSLGLCVLTSNSVDVLR